MNMKIAVIFITIFACLLIPGDAVNENEINSDINNVKEDEKIEDIADEDLNIEDEVPIEITPCLSEHCIYKCCPFGQCIKKKICTPCNAVFNLTSIKVYDENIKDTGKNILDIFDILPGIFLNDTDFRDMVTNVHQIKLKPYVIENGMLETEMPNTYHRWTPIDNKNFCIDYFIRKNGTLSASPNFWAIIKEVDIPENSLFLTGAMLVSCVFLLIVFIVYMLLPELQNICGMILMAYVASLFMAFLLLATIQLDVYDDNACIGLTVAIYYFFLASFCWMNVMSYDIWWTFRGYAKARPIHRRGEIFKFIMYCLYAWGLPFLMALGLWIINTVPMSQFPWFVTPHMPLGGCFLENEVKMLYLYTPMLILILSNWMFYLMTAFNVWRLSRGTAVLDSAAAGTPAAHRSQRNRLMVYLKLSVVMGVNWLFEIISFQYPDFKVWYISDAYNILIGLLIFLIFVCKKEIYRKLYKRYSLNMMRRVYPGSSKSYSSSSSDAVAETTTFQICANPKGYKGYPGSMRSI